MPSPHLKSPTIYALEVIDNVMINVSISWAFKNGSCAGQRQWLVPNCNIIVSRQCVEDAGVGKGCLAMGSG